MYILNIFLPMICTVSFLHFSLEYYIGSYDDYSLPRDRISSDEGFRTHVAKKIHLPQEVHGGSTQSANPDQKVCQGHI